MSHSPSVYSYNTNRYRQHLIITAYVAMAWPPTPPSTPKQCLTTSALRPTTNVFFSVTVIQPANPNVAARPHAGLRTLNVLMWPRRRRRWPRPRQKHRSILALPVQPHEWLLSVMFMGFVFLVGLSLVWPLSCSEVSSNSNYEPVQAAHYLALLFLSWVLGMNLWTSI